MQRCRANLFLEVSKTKLFDRGLVPVLRRKVSYAVAQFDEEATPIARLFGPDGKRIAGWVYLWETSEVAILWIDERETVTFIEPAMDTETLANAKSKTPKDVMAFLVSLPVREN